MPSRSGLLVLDSAPPRLPDFAVIDVDDPAQLPWVIDTFGSSPLTVSTGREGGGSHVYYRVPQGGSVTSRSGLIGPSESIPWDYEIDPETGTARKCDRWGRSKIDVKGRRSYVVAAGSRHKTGAIYTARIEGVSVDLATLTEEEIRDLIEGLPVFDNDLYEAQVDQTKVERRARKLGGVRRRGTSARKRPPSRPPTVLSARRPPRSSLDTVTADDVMAAWPSDFAAVKATRCEANLAVLRSDPVIQWAAESPTAVGREAWRGVATNVCAVAGPDGRRFFPARTARR